MTECTRTVQVQLSNIASLAAKMRATHRGVPLGIYLADLIVQDVTKCGLMDYLDREQGRDPEIQAQLAAEGQAEASHG